MIWGARVPTFNGTEYNNLLAKGIVLGKDGDGRSSTQQGGMQAAAIFVTLAMSILGGVITG